MTDKQSLYNTVFSLIEEELHYRKNPIGYKDYVYDGTNISICGSSNLDMQSFSGPTDNSSKRCTKHCVHHYGGNCNCPSNCEMKGGLLSKPDSSKFIPGKFDVIKHSYNVPLSIAIKGTVERQKLFELEHHN